MSSGTPFRATVVAKVRVFADEKYHEGHFLTRATTTEGVISELIARDWDVSEVVSIRPF